MTLRNRTDHDGSRRVVGLLVGALVALVGLSLLPRAGAVEESTSAVTSTTCDQTYGCNPSTTEPAAATTCGLSSTSVTAGDTVTATVTNVPVGNQIQITFNGSVVASAVSTADGQGQQALSQAVAPAGYLMVAAVVEGGAKITFRVPSSTAAGTYEVRAIGAGFNANCATGTNGLEVKAAVLARAGGGGSLSATGIEVATYLAAALVLLILGWQLVLMARRRTRRQGGSRNARQRHSVRN